MRITNLLSELLTTGLAGITLISEQFLAYCPPMSRKSQKGMFTAILKCILLDFDKKSGYFLFLLSIFSSYYTSAAEMF